MTSDNPLKDQVENSVRDGISSDAMWQSTASDAETQPNGEEPNLVAPNRIGFCLDSVKAGAAI